MAGSTFLNLTNKLLRRLNEVEVTESAFPSAKNVHSAAKDCIVAAISEINTREYQWPWNKKLGSASATFGTQLFTLPTVQSTPYWDSFRIVGDSANSITSTKLYPISEEEWFAYRRQSDVDNPTGTTPTHVFPTVGGFGITPMPQTDRTYTINYEYYSTPEDLDNPLDVNSIPSVWDYVIINMALKHYYMYKDNTEQANYWTSQADRSFTVMKNSFINRPDAVWSNMVNFGGNRWSNNYKV